MYKTMFSTVGALLTLLLCVYPGDVAACTWVLWKEVVEGRDIVRPEQPWFLVKTFSDREACGLLGSLCTAPLSRRARAGPLLASPAGRKQAARRLTRRSCLVLGERQEALLVRLGAADAGGNRARSATPLFHGWVTLECEGRELRLVKG